VSTRTASPNPPATGSHPPTGDLALIAVGVLGVSTSGPLIAATAAPALAIAFWRNGLAAAVLGAYGMRGHRAELLALPRRVLLLAVAAGLLLAAHFAAWIPSLAYTSVASSTALVTMQAGWATVFARLAGHPVSRRVWCGLALALVGVLLVTGVDVSLSRRALTGDLLALLGGVFSGAYVVLGSVVRRTVSTTAYTVVAYGVAAVALLVACLLAGRPLVGFSTADWTRILALTVAAQLLGHSLFNRVLRTVSPTVVSLAILLEVPGAAVIAAVWLGQVPPLAALPAVALILLGIAITVTGTGRAAGPLEPAA